MSTGPDYDHMRNVIVFQMEKLAKNDRVDRQIEFGKFITFLNEMHCSAVTSLAGAVLFSTLADQNKDKIPEMMDAVRKLVEAVDAEFSLSLRNQILDVAVQHKLPNPFAIPKTPAKGQQ